MCNENLMNKLKMYEKIQKDNSRLLSYSVKMERKFVCIHAYIYKTTLFY